MPEIILLFLTTRKTCLNYVGRKSGFSSSADDHPSRGLAAGPQNCGATQAPLLQQARARCLTIATLSERLQLELPVLIHLIMNFGENAESVTSGLPTGDTKTKEDTERLSV